MNRSTISTVPATSSRADRPSPRTAAITLMSNCVSRGAGRVVNHRPGRLASGLAGRRASHLACWTTLACMGAFGVMATPSVADASPGVTAVPSTAFPVDGLGGNVFATAVFDDGSGPSLYVGGAQGGPDQTDHGGLSRWTGTGWEPVGGGVSGSLFDNPLFPHPIRAMTVFDDGSGPALYVAGDFTHAGGIEVNGIARWDGTSWSALGSGLFRPSQFDPSNNDASPLALVVHDDGRGPALYVGGNFASAGGVPAADLARWDGRTWSAVGGAITDDDDRVESLAVFDDGDGAALFIGGKFETFGGVPADHVVRWDGSAFAPLGSGVAPGADNVIFVAALHVHDDGSGPALYAAGNFRFAGGSSAANIARWDGATWSALGSGITESTGCDFDFVYALATVPEAGGATLWAGGLFCAAGGIPSRDLARWNGSAWSPVEPDVTQYAYGETVRTIIPFDDGSGPAVWVGAANDRGIARRRLDDPGATWDAVDAGVGLTQFAQDLEVIETGPAAGTYAVVTRTRIGDSEARDVVRYDGTTWTQLDGANLDDPINEPADPVLTRYVLDIVRFGDDLIVAGQFEKIGGVSASNIARFDGTQWHPLGTGMSGTTPGDADPTTEVRRLQVLETEDGPRLFARGNFSQAGSAAVVGVAEWDGTAWDVPFTLGSDGRIYAPPFAVFDDGSGDGPAVYGVAADEFIPGGGFYSRLGRSVDGGVFEPVLDVQILGTPIFAIIEDLEVAQTASGAQLVVAGSFSGPLGVDAPGVFAWTGSEVRTLGDGLKIDAPGVFGGVADVVATDLDGDGTDAILAVGTFFGSGDDTSATSFAAWTGSDWTGLGSTLDSNVRELRVVADPGGGPSTAWLAGNFQRFGSTSMAYAGSASLVVDGAPCPADLDGSGTVDLLDLLTVLSQWGTCPAACSGDIDGDGLVGLLDLLTVLGDWGACS